MVTAVVVGALLACAASWRAASAVARRVAVTRRFEGVRASSGDGDRAMARPAPTVPVPARVRAAIEAAALPFVPETVWRGWLVATLLVAGGGAVAGGPALATLAVGAAVAGAVVALSTAQGRAAAAYAAALPDALEAVARALRSGASLPGAVAEAAATTPGTLGRDLGHVTAQVQTGVPFTAALDAWAERRPERPVTLTVAALALASATGGASARAVDGVAATLRERLAVDGEVRALSSQAHASAAVISLAPVAFCALAATVDPANARFLLRTPLGLAFLAAGLTLDAVAAVWMHRLTRVEA